MIRSSGFPEKKKKKGFYGENYNCMSLKTLGITQQIFGKFTITAPHHQSVVIFFLPSFPHGECPCNSHRYSSVLAFEVLKVRF